MRKLTKILFFILFIPTMALAQNFSTVFTGFAGNVPIKLQLTNFNNKIIGTYGYSHQFDNSYIANSQFIRGQITKGHLRLTTGWGDSQKTLFEGKLTTSTQDGLSLLQLQGHWRDTQNSINSNINFNQQVIDSDTKHPIVTVFKTSVQPSQLTTTQLGYPQFVGSNLSSQEMAINASIEKFVNEQKSDFKKEVGNGYQLVESKNAPSNSFSFLTQSAITQAYPDVLSIRFMLFTSMYHAAHPNTTYKSLNFDTKTGKEISLANLFKANSDYLTTLSDIVRPVLFKKLYPNKKELNPKNFNTQWVYQGTAPKAKNYAIWNIYNNNLMITFPAYQVAAYVYGEQTVLIPLNKLANIAKPDGLIDQLLKKEG